MPPISLDEIIHYRPPTEKTQFQEPQSISLCPQNYSNPSSEGPILSSRFPPNQVWPMGFPLSTHAQGPRMISRSPVESGPSLPLTELAGKVALDLSDEMGMDFPNVALEEATDGPISNAHWPNSDLLNVFDGASLTGPGNHCENRSQDYRWRQGTHISPLQHPGEPDSVKEPTVSSLASPRDDPFPAAEGNESENETMPSKFADSAKVEGRILQDSSTTVSATTKEHLNTTTNEHTLSSTDKKNHDPPPGLLSGDVTSSMGDVEVAPDKLRPNSPVCTNSEKIPPQECGGHSIAERCERIQAGANEAVVTDAENELPYKEIDFPSASCESNRIRSSGRPISISPILQRCGRQSTCNRTETDANLPSVSELQSVVINSSRSRERDVRKIAPLAPTARPKRKRRPSVPSHDGGCSDGSNDADDVEDVRESSILSRRSIGTGRMAEKGSPTHLRHNKTPRRNVSSRRSISRASRIEESHHQVTRDQRPISSLSDIETVPIRGFLTREILLSKVVYSITFEERAEHTCLQEPGGTLPDCERKAERSKLPRQQKSQVGKSLRSAQKLSEDDKLLIDLKEEKGLAWKQIGEHFPGRSVGSLQVRYSTRLKRRRGRRFDCSEDPKSHTAHGRPYREEPCQRSEFFATNVNSHATRGPLSQRYGPPRRRQTVDRYSPV